LTGAVGGLLGSLALPRRGAAQPGVVPLNDRLSLVTRGRTNILALSTPDGLVIVDSGDPALRDPVMESLRPLSPSGRVDVVFNTHWHTENTGANDILRPSGATIIAHENTRLWMATPIWLPAEDRYRQPRPKTAHPNKTFYADGAMNVANERIEYGYLIEAHTSGDIYVFFRESNVLAVGDVASPARDPELDSLTGAWLGGRVDAMSRLLQMGDDKTRIVPGFGPVMTRAQLQAERDMMKTIYERAVDRVREGDSAEDMIEAGLLRGFALTWSDPHTFVRAVHKGLWAHHNKLNPNVV
jgi:glyoxylase-like metal-dependent hydrolase (beta-lactamase superfamily II)